MKKVAGLATPKNLHHLHTQHGHTNLFVSHRTHIPSFPPDIQTLKALDRYRWVMGAVCARRRVGGREITSSSPT